MNAKLVLKTAYERGREGCTFATADELRVHGYDAAFRLGAEYRDGRVVEPHVLVACGCPACRFDKIIMASALQ